MLWLVISDISHYNNLKLFDVWLYWVIVNFYYSKCSQATKFSIEDYILANLITVSELSLILDVTLCLSNRLAVTDNSGNRESDENSEADCLDIGEEEQFYINGVVQKSDSSGRNEVMATVQWCNNVIKDDSSFTSYVESTGEAAQEGVAGKEESIDEENQPAAPPMPYKSTAAIMANQNDHNYYETTYLTNNIDQLKLVFVCCHYRQ